MVGNLEQVKLHSNRGTTQVGKRGLVKFRGWPGLEVGKNRIHLPHVHPFKTEANKPTSKTMGTSAKAA